MSSVVGDFPHRWHFSVPDVSADERLPGGGGQHREDGEEVEFWKDGNLRHGDGPVPPGRRDPKDCTKTSRVTVR